MKVQMTRVSFFHLRCLHLDPISPRLPTHGSLRLALSLPLLRHVPDELLQIDALLLKRLLVLQDWVLLLQPCLISKAKLLQRRDDVLVAVRAAAPLVGVGPGVGDQELFGVLQVMLEVWQRLARLAFPAHPRLNLDTHALK